ncbi:TetR/AcrR family transcriptional regulator [Pseudolysinimonas yzui]|uniref:TetR family transcriptional regulator n=1 Tax=Pseudolysinimonas yzui TaxID=2708254 RepID=A0A8J3GNI3_9MICO|nr:TetR/AcrR family transcriptional regulator C-terminal domain-containing protein [Pseudolysinimonas yzui]GHF07582.1 TetR family transcriptional regulator [Pseudolysinimonas yzui]
MSTAHTNAPRRVPVTRELVLRTAVDLADAAGIDALTMRRLAEELDLGVMSLYYHLPNKEAILDGIVDVIFGEIDEALTDLPPAPGSWKTELRSRILGARAVMLRHPWAPAIIESRPSVGLAMARYVDALIGIMHSGGLDYDLIHHAMHALGSRAYGFVQELGESQGGGDGLEQMAAEIPNLVEMLTQVRHDDPESTLGWCDDQVEFEFGLDLILDGLERLRR